MLQEVNHFEELVSIFELGGIVTPIKEEVCYCMPGWAVILPSVLFLLCIVIVNFQVTAAVA